MAGVRPDNSKTRIAQQLFDLLRYLPYASLFEYLEVNFKDDLGELAVLIQRTEGETPAKKAGRLTKEVAALRNALMAPEVDGLLGRLRMLLANHEHRLEAMEKRYPASDPDVRNMLTLESFVGLTNALRALVGPPEPGPTMPNVDLSGAIWITSASPSDSRVSQ